MGLGLMAADRYQLDAAAPPPPPRVTSAQHGAYARRNNQPRLKRPQATQNDRPKRKEKRPPYGLPGKVRALSRWVRREPRHGGHLHQGAHPLHARHRERVQRGAAVRLRLAAAVPVHQLERRHLRIRIPLSLAKWLLVNLFCETAYIPPPKKSSQ